MAEMVTRSITFYGSTPKDILRKGSAKPGTKDCMGRVRKRERLDARSYKTNKLEKDKIRKQIEAK